MRCLRIYAREDGESHFDEVEIRMTSRQLHAATAVFEMSTKYEAAAIRFTRIPAGARDVGWHTVPERVLTVRLGGSAEYETSDREKRTVPESGFILFEDTHGKGHRTIHSLQEQTVMWISLPNGLDDR
ncbi:MAG: hypothetical protein AAGB04_27955 [Pseudomonadota bacterium]